MTISIWLFPSVFALIVWGIGAFLPKLAIARLPSLHLFVYQTSFFFISAIAVQMYYGSLPVFEKRGVLLAILSGVTGALGQLFYLFSLQAGSISMAVVMTSLYPLISTLLAVMILHETVGIQQLLGIALGILSSLLMVNGEEKQ